MDWTAKTSPKCCCETVCVRIEKRKDQCATCAAEKYTHCERTPPKRRKRNVVERRKELLLLYEEEKKKRKSLSIHHVNRSLSYMKSPPPPEVIKEDHGTLRAFFLTAAPRAWCKTPPTTVSHLRQSPRRRLWLRRPRRPRPLHPRPKDVHSHPTLTPELYKN